MVYFAEMLEMVKYLHSKDILFRDFKAENLLLDFFGHLKLTDFGLARKLSRDLGRQYLSFCGSPIYIAPETLQRKSYDHKVDFYALGVLLFEMLTGKPPKTFTKEEMQNVNLLDSKIDYPRDMDPKIVEILRGCLEGNPELRITDHE